MTNSLEIEISRIARESLDDIKRLVETATKFSRAHRNETRDTDEAEDNIARMNDVARRPRIKEGLCEIAGLIRRARTELANGNLSGCSTTLGRVASAIDNEINK